MQYVSCLKQNKSSSHLPNCSIAVNLTEESIWKTSRTATAAAANKLMASSSATTSLPLVQNTAIKNSTSINKNQTDSFILITVIGVLTAFGTGTFSYLAD